MPQTIVERVYALIFNGITHASSTAADERDWIRLSERERIAEAVYAELRTGNVEFRFADLEGQLAVPRICGHCQRPIRGMGSVGGTFLCHPDDGMDCYRLVTLYGHPMPCDRLDADRRYFESVDDLVATLEDTATMDTASNPSGGDVDG
jgi:hypothetical protein